MRGLFDKAFFRLVGDRGLLVEYGDEISPEINLKVLYYGHGHSRREAGRHRGGHPDLLLALLVYDPLGRSQKSRRCLAVHGDSAGPT